MVGRAVTAHAVLAGSDGAVGRLQEERQVHDVAQIVVAVDARLAEQPVQVVLDALDDDVRIHGQDGDERRVLVSEQHVHRVQHLSHNEEDACWR